MDELAAVLGRLIEDPKYTEEIGTGFASMLLLIVAGAFEEHHSGGMPDREAHRRKCVALSKLVHCCPDVLRFEFVTELVFVGEFELIDCRLQVRRAVLPSQCCPVRGWGIARVHTEA